MLREDGRRLKEALNRLGWSQTVAARKSGVPQGRLTELVSGARGIVREDLRRLAKAGIPADYVLGTAATFTPIGDVRDQNALEEDLARTIERELTRAYPPEVPGEDTEFAWLVDGRQAFAAALTAMEADAIREFKKEVERPRLDTEIAEAEALVEFVLQGHKDRPGSIPEPVMQAAAKLYRRLPKLRHAYAQLNQLDDSGVVLTYRTVIERHLKQLAGRRTATEGRKRDGKK